MVRRTAVVLLLAFFLASSCARAQPAPQQPGAPLSPAAPVVSAPDSPQAMFRAKADAQQAEVRAFSSDVAAALVAGRFDDLDRQADDLRQTKARWPGGSWKLGSFYFVLEAPSGPDQGTEDHLARLQQWVKLRPESITARVALAQSLLRWAWVARGNNSSQEVPEDGFPLFFKRLSEVRAVLDAAAGLRTMCPQWFSVMLVLGRSQQWNLKQMQDVLARGQQFAPDYQSIDQNMAHYLLPKWYGKPGDTDKFARAAADQTGGDEGDLLYFQIVSSVLNRNNEGSLGKEMDWPRLERGHAVLVRQFGETRATRNDYAYMAGRCGDFATLRAQLQFNWRRLGPAGVAQPGLLRPGAGLGSQS